MLDNYMAGNFPPKKLIYPPQNCVITRRLNDIIYGLHVEFGYSVEWLYYHEEGGKKIIVDYRIVKE